MYSVYTFIILSTTEASCHAIMICSETSVIINFGGTESVVVNI